MPWVPITNGLNNWVGRKVRWKSSVGVLLWSSFTEYYYLRDEDGNLGEPFSLTGNLSYGWEGWQLQRYLAHLVAAEEKVSKAGSV